ncbi:MAG: ATP-binding cassette domain-containing protein, partial [Chloroflexia bacterium]|nr:ATP-binding cassette domain-containing protein [Chloroflexia bacterium]
ELSGGEQQRAALARSLMNEPDLLLADEPTANLDTANGQHAMEIMQKLNQDTGTAFIFATHDPRVIHYARRVVTLTDGRVIEDSALAEHAV